MARALPLTAAVLAALAAGCDLTDCSFPDALDVDVVPLSAAAPPPADSVVVALVPLGGAGRGLAEAVAAGAVGTAPSADDSVRVRVELVAEAGVPQRAAAVAAGDTVWVRLGPAALVRPACSPPPVPGEVGALRVEVPEGVTVRSVVVVAPGAAPAAPPARPGAGWRRA